MKQQTTTLRDVNKPHYNYWQALVLSFYSNRLYVDVGKRWFGLAVVYLLIVVFIFASPFALRITNDFNDFFNQQLLKPLRELPPITIQNGQVSMDKPMPYLIKNKAGDVVSIIDTTGTVTGEDKRYPHLTSLITKDRFTYWPPSPQFFFMKDDTSQTKTPIVQIFTPQMNEIFDGNKWIESSGIETVKYLSLVIIYPMVILIFYVMYLTFFLVFAMIAQLVSKMFFNLELRYGQACRLLIVSSTPQIALLLIGLALNALFPGFGFLVLILLAFYFSYAVISLRKESKKVVLS